MKSILNFVLFISILTFITSCSKDEDPMIPEDNPELELLFPNSH